MKGLLKKAMDILDIHSWVNKYSSVVTGCLIDNAYHYKSYWILKLRCREGVYIIKIEPGVRMHLSRSHPEEKDIDGFTRFLRSRIRDSRITSIKQPWWERIILFETSIHDKTLKHYVELLPRVQWIITDQSNKIVYASRFMEYRDRSIKPSEAYSPPPLKSPPPSDKYALLNVVKGGRDLVRTIISAWGIPGHIAEEAIHRAGLYGVKNKGVLEIPYQDLEKLVDEYRRIVNEASNGKGYLVYGDENKLEIYTSYEPRLFSEVYDKTVKPLDDINTAIDVYFTEYEAYLDYQARMEEITEKLREIEARIKRQEEIIAEYNNEIENIESILQTIYSNYHVVEEILECARETREKKGWEHIVEECNGVIEVRKDKGVIVVKLSEKTLELSIREDLSRQVIELERKRGELVRKTESAKKVLEEMHHQLNTISISMNTEEKTIRKPSPTFWYERFHWLFTRNGFLAIGGRDQSQNELVVRKYLGENDVFIHADIHGGSAVVLKSGGAHSLEDVVDASYLAACYSKAWKAGFSYIEVYWVPGRQVSKTPPPGEYLPRGAFMVYGSKNYLQVPLRLGIGVREYIDDIYGEYLKIVVGPQELVRSQAMAYVVITPGDKKPHDISKEIAGYLEEIILRQRGVKYKIPLSEIESKIPGSSDIMLVSTPLND
ncbi:MAG: ribosome rescue protein RqcH [Desulfurococcus sp.]|uniref:ribosome rescue protein RqcH n=1 Tax=Desulfurococcus sp. TaxID=51678 RepID=UPI003168CAA4